MEKKNNDVGLLQMKALEEKACAFYDKAEIAHQKAKEALNNNKPEEQEKHMHEYYKLTKRHLNIGFKMSGMCKSLVREKQFEKASLLYFDQCKANGTVPEQPLLKDSISGKKYYYLKIGKRALAKFDKASLN